MDGSHFPNLGVTERSGPAKKLARAMLEGASALVIGKAGTAELLRSAGRLLAAGSTRVVRVHPPLELPEFLEQVASASPVLEQSALERAYEVLTVPDPGCDRVVLLVEDAHAMPHPTLHYIEMALRAGPKLQVVLAGQPALLDKLALDGFTSLRRRLGVRMDLAPSEEPAPPVEAPRSKRAWRLDMWAGALAAGAAALGLFLHGHHPAAPPPPAIAMAPQQAPVPPRVLAEVEIVMVPPAAPAEASAPMEAAGPVPALPAAVVETAAHPLPEQPAMSVATPVPPRPAPPRPAPVRAERVASTPAQPTSAQPASAQNERRCRDIVLRAQLGDAPDNADQTFLRNGCR